MKLRPGKSAGLIITLLILLFMSASCSSVPKKPVEVFTNRNMASNQLDLANSTANQGHYSDALLIIEDVLRVAVSVDDPPLISKAYIYRGNILFSLGRYDEAFSDWESASEEAGRSADNDLAALAQIYSARGRLMLLINSGAKDGVQELRDQVDGLVSSIKSDVVAQAMGYLVLGMTEKELQHYAEAEKAVRRALDIHDKNRYLEEAAYDWYFLASIFSVSGRYDDALQALQNSIAYDRRAENGYGLAADWQATGEVYLKKNMLPDSAAAFKRAADIYRANGLEDLAVKSEAMAPAAGN